MLTDLRLAIRSLRRTPGFAAATFLCLALGIGANTVAFSILDAIVLRPLPFPDAARLVDLHETSATKLCAGCGVGTSYEGFLDWQRSLRTVDAVGAYLEEPVVLGRSDGGSSAARSYAERVRGATVSGATLALVGARPVVGRALVAADDRAGAERVVVLGHALWRRRFGGDSSIVGRAIPVNGVAHTIVGVLAPRFRFPEMAEVWVPLASAPPASDRDARGPRRHRTAAAGRHGRRGDGGGRGARAAGGSARIRRRRPSGRPRRRRCGRTSRATKRSSAGRSSAPCSSCSSSSARTSPDCCWRAPRRGGASWRCAPRWAPAGVGSRATSSARSSCSSRPGRPPACFAARGAIAEATRRTTGRFRTGSNCAPTRASSPSVHSPRRSASRWSARSSSGARRARTCSRRSRRRGRRSARTGGRGASARRSSSASWR